MSPSAALYTAAFAVIAGPTLALLVLLIAVVLAVWLVRVAWRTVELAADTARHVWAHTRRPPRSALPRVPDIPRSRSPRAWPPRHPRRTTHPTGAPQAMHDYCVCGHICGDHVNGTKRCRGEGDEGERCACATFETGVEIDED